MKEDFNGKVNMEKYYHKLGTNGDVSLLNLVKNHYTMPKIVDLVVNGMVNRLLYKSKSNRPCITR
jgi:hypothetical protein